MVDPTEDPVAYAQIKAAIEEQERQHQAIMTEIKNAGEFERNQYTLGAMNSIQSAPAKSMQQLMRGQKSLGQCLQSMWTSVLQPITAEIAKSAAKWIMQRWR